MDTDTLEALGQSSETDPDAIQEPAEETPEQLISRGIIPDGYTFDQRTKQIRPKKRRGRQGSTTPSPRPDMPIQRGTDEAPDSKLKGKVRQPVPRYQKGVIAAGMTKLYRRTGKIVKAMDSDIGTAVIESAEDCGEAWEELARTNPEVRRVLMKMISGGAWGSVIMAHLPIFMAIIMKDAIRRRLPFQRLMNAVLEDSHESSGNLNELLGNMSQEDMQQMMSMAQSLMGGMASRAAQNGEG